ncbi:MAG TPA: hypothetical protein VGE94_14465 [Chloroflexota bacterium]
MQTTLDPKADPDGAVEAARVAIWRLYQEGYVDEDMATASLLAVDLGTRRTRRTTGQRGQTQRVMGGSRCAA